MVKIPPTNAGDIRDLVSIPGSGRFPRGEHGNPLRYSAFLPAESSDSGHQDRGAWQVTFYRVSKSQTQLR